ncbi:MAG TPA: RnfABCDGE type electron transport complex subunit D [bacterium]|nr:RnfABCDGE type electron transport complex subunit D [bacterium]HOL48788.1 RnfABCDGE type electron transport complex subunit D [bacterium]HPQ19808.1 RnfABCDGE type electron transport complex subunit D [bacterium]
MEQKNKVLLEISPAPHIHSKDTVQSIMLDVIIALMPAVAIAVFYFGINAIRIILVSIISCVLFELLVSKLLSQKIKIKDLSAVVTGLLLALNLSATAPNWLIIIGAFVAIAIGKQIFGGIGYNIFNPALVGRVFLLIAFPVEMTSWVPPNPVINLKSFMTLKQLEPDAISYATPLAILKGKGPSALPDNIHLDAFFGNIGGCIGEISALALIIGGLYLLYKGHISLRIPLSFILTTFIITGIFWAYKPTNYADPLFHILTGGLLLGAIFMATDMVTSPSTETGMIIFGIGCGFITAIIRLFGAYPEGVSFSILIMNGLVPLIDKLTKPKRFGLQK